MPSFLTYRFRFKNLLEFYRHAEAHPWTKSAGRLSRRRIKQLRKSDRYNRLVKKLRKGCERPLAQRPPKIR